MVQYIYFTFLLPQVILANYSCYKVTAFNSIERTILYKMNFKNGNFYFINDVTNEAIIPMEVIVKNSYAQSFEKKLIMNDIQFSLDTSFNINKQPSPLLPKGKVKFFDWDVVNTWVSKYAKEHPGLTKIVITKTYQNRDLFILRLSTGKRNAAVFILSGEVGRDWLTPAITLNLIKELLVKRDLRTLTDYYDFYFLPFMNPDGYVYSRKKMQFWAKNRKQFTPQIMCSSNFTAQGVNLDRNWHFAKSSHNEIDQECNAVYIGQWPLSEEETQALLPVLNNLALGLMAFINLKSFNRLITIPYANEIVSVNHDIVMELIKLASNKIKEKYNQTYYFGTTAKYIYNSSGNVADWVKNMLNIPIVYTVHLQHKDDVLPKSQNIEPLTQQLCTILNETLVMARDIYGPLFNRSSEENHTCVICLLIIFKLFY